MLGTVADAEDMLQETFFRWLQAADDEIRSPRAFLLTIISRLCINQLQSARAQREEYFGHWLPEPLATSEGNDPLGLIRVDETLSMAFLVLFERLTPIERAVFLLREVFEYEYAEISAILGQSEVNCRQILSRARQHVSTSAPCGQGSRPRRKISAGFWGSSWKLRGQATWSNCFPYYPKTLCSMLLVAGKDSLRPSLFEAPLMWHVAPMRSAS
jgi:RNA polymerase sigma-70 factor (ECF subfamily)